ncbi:hypothetical protein IFM89_029107 [Coptis chinensis]|uniref:Mitochondrial import inner membrane translocase subunit TIM50 n=1 Tax=Coptis chinensis TaxID=261450 RepID=A0A835MA62_9MAGN|nr:hypothetical protein IFM89_029107 [Coptis chinensis]
MYRRLVLYLCKHKKPISFSSSSSNNNRYLCTQSTTTSLPKDQQPQPPRSDGTTKMNSWNYLKYGAYATLAGLSGTVAYQTYVPAKCIDIYLELRRSIEGKIREYTEPYSDKLLPDLAPELKGLGVMTLVVDLNETLIYSDWKFVDPICERLNQKGTITYRLGRTATKYQNGKHYKDLSKLNRDPAKVIYVSGHALETALQLDNCLEIKPWKLEEGDTALLDLVPFLEFLAYRRPQDIRKVLESYRGCDVATEFHERQR